MAWSKDAVSQSPKVIYTPGNGDTGPSVVRLIYDPNASQDRRWTAEMSGLSAVNQSLAEVETILGLG